MFCEDKLLLWCGFLVFVSQVVVIAGGQSFADVGPHAPLLKAEVTQPQSARLGETADLTLKVSATTNDVTQFKINLVNLQGVEVLEGKSEIESSLKKGETKEFSFRVKFVSAPVVMGFMTRTFRIREGNQERSFIEKGGSSLDLILVDMKTGQLGPRPPRRWESRDQNAELQKELSLPDSGYWYSVALHLRDDLGRYATAKGISYEEAKKILKDRAERMSREEKVEKSKAYETILTHRLLWKEAKLPDPSEVKKVP